MNEMKKKEQRQGQLETGNGSAGEEAVFSLSASPLAGRHIAASRRSTSPLLFSMPESSNTHTQ